MGWLRWPSRKCPKCGQIAPAKDRRCAGCNYLYARRDRIRPAWRPKKKKYRLAVTDLKHR